MSDDYSMLAVEEAERKPSSVSGTPHVDLVSELGCEEMRPKVWFLSPGDEMSFHRQTEQEEFYYVLEGPGRMKVGADGETSDVAEGTAVRVPPETPRQILNDTDDGEHVWLVVGAPPTEDDGRPAFDDDA
ncbi:cupin domain-containing protein [Natronomonas sp. F2-12]|jgi:mannose-6-phosphate isomerase-like protein (cupin superfamily)|uniref:Cupin domain-containing protein n=1 Tax=Natronomonas aquatica TaxID=2841590 RepID=A0A9R1CNL5_9EURY|nr:cupin domain-containing protein [Natronomonas aquatica]MCQ4332104.1 cupin domain-containing protein [Natronomonas aquatica]